MVKGDVFTHSPHQSRREAWDIPGAALGCLRKQRRYFKTRGEKKAKQINSCLLDMTDWRHIIRQDSKMPG